MTNGGMAETYIPDAAGYLDHARADHARGAHHCAIRQAHDCVELCLKGILRLLAVEFPKSHEVSKALRQARPAMPAWLAVEIERVSAASQWLAERRGPAFYGNEEKGIPPADLFTAEDGRRAVAEAEHVRSLAVRLLEEWRRAGTETP